MARGEEEASIGQASDERRLRLELEGHFLTD